MTMLGEVRTTLEQHDQLTIAGEKEIVSFIEDPDKPERLSKVTIYVSPSEPMTFAHLTDLQMRLFEGARFQPVENTYFSRLKPEAGVIRFSDSIIGDDMRQYDQVVTVKVFKNLETATHTIRHDDGW